MPTDLPERKGPSKSAVIAEAAAGYLVGVLGFVAFNAFIAVVIMWCLSIMNDYEPSVPPLGFAFLHAALIGASTLALGAGVLVRMVLKEE